MAEYSFTIARRWIIVLILAALSIRELQQLNFLSFPTTTSVARQHDPHSVDLPLSAESSNATSMRACILVKNDNRRLAEWVAYHYTVLPLRHLIVGSDVNSTEDPMDVMKRWNETDLVYQVWYGNEIVEGLQYKYGDGIKNYIERQSNFYSLCMQYFHKKGNLGWVALSDSDEYLKLNPLDDVLDKRFFPKGEKPKKELDNNTMVDSSHFLSSNETWWDRVEARKTLRDRLKRDYDNNQSSIPTVVDVLESYTSHHSVPSCYAVARLQYSAVTDNFLDLAASVCRPKLNPDIVASMNISELTTIRYIYHANPDVFDHNKWAKVLIDLRNYSIGSLSQIKKQLNPHAPLDDCRRPPFIPDLVSLLRVNHYLNDVSVYVGRQDDPRRKKTSDWSISAHIRHRVTCDHMHAWLNELVDHFGIERAKELLRQ